MKKILISVAALALSANFAMADTIRLGTEGAYPPYNFINEAGEVDGFERELGDELCKRAELECVWVTNEWDSIIPNLTTGNYDTIIAGMSITAERDEVIDFTQNYTPPSPSLYVAASADIDPTTAIVAAQTSTIQSGHVAASGATLVEFATADEAVAAVKNGEADAAFADLDYMAPIVAESGGALVVVGEPVPLGGGVGMGVRESDNELRDKFDAAIGTMKADGTLNTMIKKWFGDDALVF
ncbi:transporter substrate-binding domain-containing protein [Maritalea sp.]|uniref:transporter substrate-binding domain-containing protein n=1 Tax=Maritalea sp. TaxID=2003361 RepID=UPI003EF8941E